MPETRQLAPGSKWINRRTYAQVRVVDQRGAFVYFESTAAGPKVEQFYRLENFLARYSEVPPCKLS